MTAIFKRELRSYFVSPTAYVLAASFFIIFSIFFISFNISSQIANLGAAYKSSEIAILIILPVLTMKVFSEEKKNNTEVLLLTSPVSIGKIVLGKYLAVITVFLSITALSLIHIMILFVFGSPHLPSLMGTLLAFILFGSLISAIGVFVSSLTESQIVAAIISFAINLVIYFLYTIMRGLGDTAIAVFSRISPMSRTDDFHLGMFRINNVIFFIVLIGLFLFFTARNIEKKRWSKG